MPDGEKDSRIKSGYYLTCFSCANYTREGCLEGLGGWPDRELAGCERGEYEPGSDEIGYNRLEEN